MILEFHGQLELYTKEMKKERPKRSEKDDEERNKVVDDFGVGDIINAEKEKDE